MRRLAAAARPDVPHPREAVRRASTARASTTTGRWRTDDGENLLDPGNDPHANAQFLAFLVAVIRGGQRPRRPAPREHRRRRQRPPPRRQRGAAGDHVDLPRLAARGRHRPARAGPRVGVEEGRRRRARRDLAAGPAEGRHGPQPDLAVRLHRQQVRVPRGRLVGARSTGRRPSSTRPSPTRSSSSPTSSTSSTPGDFEGLTTILSGIVKANKQVLFEGNGYSEEWHAEAARARAAEQQDDRRRAAGADDRRRPRSCSRAFGVLSERELASRVDINWERYVKVANIEANCAARHRLDDDPAGGGPLPRRAAAARRRRGASTRSARRSPAWPTRWSTPSTRSSTPSTRPTRRAPSRPRRRPSSTTVIPAQDALREVADELETLVADDLWPLPKYRELLFQY